METQNDPFQAGGSITSSKQTLGMIVTHLITGYACMDFLSSFSWDWSLLKGKMGCKPGAFILYFGCRYLGILSVVATVVFLDAFPVVFLNPMRYTSAIAAGLSLGFAYSIVLLRIAFMFKRTWLCICIDVLKFTFWGIMFRTMSQLPTLLREGLSVQLAEAAYCLAVASLVFAASLFQALYVCRKEHHFRIRELAHALAREDVVELAFLWAANVLTSVRNTK
ncbi:uncharacterized protein TRAVEDRAFT_31282 [Trametes versicolor FP-101664 SS1]|uniref:uncharacterized protein n=1 Tax=Trametes versicolor (strain FP-101664) TaxID=717944 RepID=UPI0004622462|nr:uncharacterized protein TRAVEDRAFT_31282 [Trametes versicolor FP-101664 SS1]EIW54154.1 hypothetical protein TRAVEDRAFT_31282 [Trametes versicolor FP-101664 SS1]